jgi:endonuclease-3 related protein
MKSLQAAPVAETTNTECLTMPFHNPDFMMSRKITQKRLSELYRRLLRHFGPRKWWPARTPFEVAVGAVLTQNTNWQNVRKAIANLQEAGLLTFRALRAVSLPRLGSLIRPAGYYNVKARRLSNLLRFLEQFGGNLARLGKNPAARELLLAVNGIGPETADSILLYACNLPFFVIDAYTKRIFMRHGLCRPEADYDRLQAFCQRHLPQNVSLYNDFHAQIVECGAVYCRKRPNCKACPLREDPHEHAL